MIVKLRHSLWLLRFKNLEALCDDVEIILGEAYLQHDERFVHGSFMLALPE